MNTHDSSSSISPDFYKFGLIEIQGENGAFYPGYIYDVEDSGKSFGQNLSSIGGDSGGLPSSGNTNNVNNDSLITVTFKNNSFPQSQLPISRIRLPPVSSNNANNINDGNIDESVKSLASGLSSVHLANNVSSSNVTSTSAANSQSISTGNNAVNSDETPITIGMEVEVFSSCSKDEPKGWWRAIVKMTKGNVYLSVFIS